VPLAYGRWSALVALGILLATWILLGTLLNIYQRVQATRGQDSWVAALARQPRNFLGMHLAHLGVAAFIVGVSLVKGYEAECDVKMAEGDTTEVAGYQFKFQGIRTIQGPNYQAQQGEVEVFRNGTMVAQLRPEKRNYASSAMPMTEASIDAGLLRDVYVSLGEPIDKSQPEGAWAVRVYYKPFVDWIWAGCVLMALGGLVAVSDRRYRNRRSPRTTA